MQIGGFMPPIRNTEMKKKKFLGLTGQSYFYDIYSSLGLHRTAMNDYIKG